MENRKINEISGRLSAGCDLAYNKKGKYSVWFAECLPKLYLFRHLSLLIFPIYNYWLITIQYW